MRTLCPVAEIAHPTQPRMSPKIRKFLRPKMSPSLPTNGAKIADVIMFAVTIQVYWLFGPWEGSVSLWLSVGEEDTNRCQR